MAYRPGKLTKPRRCYVDRGYRGHGVTDTAVYISGQRRGLTHSIRRELKRRSAVEPEIGHMKRDGHLGRCYLKGQEGDAMNVLLVACGHNLRKILASLRSFFGSMFQALPIPRISIFPLMLTKHYITSPENGVAFQS